MMKFLRTARLDDSDEQVYAPAAAAGEPAVTGSFVFTFSDDDPALLTGKVRQAFRSGFLGVGSFGWSTLVRVEEIDADEYQRAVDRLAHHLVEAYGAPTLAEALPFARQEMDYAASLCEAEPGTLLLIERHADADGIHEAFRQVRPSEPAPVRQVADWRGHDGEIRIWDMFPDDGAR
ncbi:MAG: DUF6505 family protein [Rhodocyclaceae bacterium]